MQLHYQGMATSSLVDLLAAETTKFTQLMAEKKYGKEYEDCKEVIQQIQAVLQSRQENFTATNKLPMNFTMPDSTL